MTGTAPTGQLGRARDTALTRALPAAALLLVLTACAPAGFDPLAAPTPPAATVTPVSAPASPSATAAPRPEDAQTSVDRLFAAALAGDRAGWDDRVATTGTGFGERSALLFANLRALRPSRLQVHLTGAEQVIPPARRAALGGTVRVAQAELRWRLRGESADARSSVWLTLVPGPRGLRLASTDDGTTLDAPALPLWWLSPTTRVVRGDVTVLVGPGQAPQRWADLAARAAKDAQAHLPRSLRERWDGHLVVEVPGSNDDFARVLGASTATYAQTAAVTRPEGPTTRAAVRVVVNPATAQETDTELGTTLTHETVHVATRSARSHAPLWAVEGLAEYVALEAHPDQRGAEVGALRTAPLPTRLPGDAAFTEGGKDVTAAYAQAWLACRAIAAHRSRSDLGRLYASLDRGDSLARAGDATLGVSQPEILDWWRSAMGQAAAARG